jgi:quercetin dioxygenase-like cupin family protein
LGQKTKQEKNIFLVNPANVTVEEFERKGAEKVQVQYLIDDRHGSERFALRLYTVQRGGHTPLDRHEYEHQVYVLSGNGLLKQSEEPVSALRALKQGDTIFIPSNAVHQFSNAENEPFVFLCVKGNPKLYAGAKQPSARAEPERNYC